jgi:hypothetical protein
MPLKNINTAGPNFVPAYQTAAVPYVTSSATIAEVPAPAANTEPIHIEFPYVTKYLTVRNTGNSGLRIGFSKSGSYAPGESGPGFIKSEHQSRNYFVVPTGSANTGFGDSTQTLDVRCKEVYFVGDGGATGFSLIAGLTTIRTGEFPILTASKGFEGIG